MSELQIFNYRNNEVRTVEKDGEPWFVLKDVCVVLGMDTTQLKKVADRLEEDEKGRTQITTLGGPQETWIINESGLYNVILRSDKPEAKPFRKWVTSEVLPSIRKHGGYISGQESMSDEDLLAKALLVAQSKIAERDRLLKDKQGQIERMRPKEIFADAVAASHTTILVGEMAKLLSQNGIRIGPNRLFSWLRNNGYLIKRKGADWNMPTQRAMEQGLFVVKESTISNPDGSVRINKTAKVTGKGQQYFINRFLASIN